MSPNAPETGKTATEIVKPAKAGEKVTRDLYCESWEMMVWNSKDTPKSLDEIRKLLESDAAKAIGWYYREKVGTRWRSQWLRMLAVLFGSIGAAIPFLASAGVGLITSGAQTELAILRINQWGYVFIVAAGACVAIDKLFGYSTNWIRFVDAATKLQTLLGKFRVEWYKQVALTYMASQSGEAVSKQFDTLLDFVAKIREVIEKETGDWIAEFRSNLTKLAEETKAMQEAREKQIQGQVDQMRQLAKEQEQKSGAITVTIKNFAALGAGFTWSLELDNVTRNVSIDDELFIMKGLAPGPYLVIARGMSGGKQWKDAKTVTVETGKSAAADLDLK